MSDEDIPAEEFVADLEFILRDAIDLIDLAMHNSGLSVTNAYHLIVDEFGIPTADYWLIVYNERLAETQ